VTNSDWLKHPGTTTKQVGSASFFFALRKAPALELTYNWDANTYSEGRNFGHLAFEVDNIYEICQRLMDAGIIINRPPRCGHMAFVRSPDNISIELLQKNGSLDAAEPWLSMENTGEW
jgi:lactoylglutathione lyase